MFNINWLEALGYIASLIIMISFLMSSIVKLRWFNLIGALAMATYGYFIHALPVLTINSAIVIVNSYYLIKMYSEKDFFKILEIPNNDKYLQHFLEYYRNDIKKFFPDFEYIPNENSICFYVLRNTVTAGVFIGKREDDGTLFIQLDYVVPEYRDFKTAGYIFSGHEKYFLTKGYKRFFTYACENKHDNYLQKIGFEKIKDYSPAYIKKSYLSPSKTIYIKEIYKEQLI